MTTLEGDTRERIGVSAKFNYSIHFQTSTPAIPNQGAVRWCQECRQLLDLLEFLVKLEVILELGCLKDTVLTI